MGEITAFHVFEEEHVQSTLAERKGSLNQILTRKLAKDIVFVCNILYLFAVQSFVHLHYLHCVSVVGEQTPDEVNLPEGSLP